MKKTILQAFSFGVLAVMLCTPVVSYALTHHEATTTLNPAPTVGAAEPSWVQPIDTFSTQITSATGHFDGVRYRLLDHQINAINANSAAYYFGVEVDLNTPRAVQSESIVRLDYQAAYERLELHQVLVKRGDQIIDKLSTATIQTLDLEPELSDLIVTGQRELVLTLKDVRVGDQLFYAYTVYGENPVFNGLREHSLSLNYSVSADRVHYRILVNKGEKLNMYSRNTTDTPEYIDKKNHSEYVLNAYATDPVDYPSDRPKWYSKQSRIVLSDIESWNDVVRWGKPMYDAAASQTEEVEILAEQLMKNHPSDAERIGAALQWVQHEVRYFGIETGINSHRPSNVNEVLQRRFGDCKDKTVLLVALLTAMNINASPALVHTRGLTRDPKRPYHLHAFNHVITHVEIDGEHHWLDPTMTGQQGALGEFFEPDYGRALILAKDENELTDMSNAHNGGTKRISKTLTVGMGADATGKLKVTTFYSGRNAESNRIDLEDNSHTQTAIDYRDYYRDHFDALTIQKPLEVTHFSRNRLMVEESYDIGTVWNTSADDDEPYRWFRADELDGVLQIPDDLAYRDVPFDIPYPFDVAESWVLELENLPDNQTYSDELENDWFSLSVTYKQVRDENRVKVRWHLRTLKKTVGVDELTAYGAAVAEADEMWSFFTTSTGFYQNDEDDEDAGETASPQNAELNNSTEGSEPASQSEGYFSTLFRVLFE